MPDFDKSNTFEGGDRVQLHPATDSWMRGDRYGEVIGTLANGAIQIRTDHNRKLTVVPELIKKVS